MTAQILHRALPGCAIIWCFRPNPGGCMARCSRFLLSLVLFSLSLAAPAQTAAPKTSAAEASAPPAMHGSGITAPRLAFEKYKLKNGLDVILLEDHRLPMVAVNLWYHVGPANERTGLTGFAHLFEHMMFEGSRHVGEKSHFKYLEAAGASDINGTTDFDRTNYFET